MVDIHPRRNPRNGTQSRAEIDLYQRFRQLDAHYTVVHSVRWRMIQPETRQDRGEADFVIIHATKGILIIEVKGGQFNGDEARTRAAEARRQATHFRYTLREWLQTDTVLRAYTWPNINLGIWLPESDWRPDPDDVFAPLFMGKTELADVASAIDAHLAADNALPLSPAQRRLLGERLNMPRGIHPLLHDRLQLNRRAFAQFSAEQHTLLSQLIHYEEAEVTGGAGTGKTVLAIQAALHMHEDGLRVLFLCFNQVQARWLRGTLAETLLPQAPPFTVLDLRGLGAWIAEAAGTAFRGAPDTDLNGENAQRRFLGQLYQGVDRLIARDALEPLRFDAIFIDEAQDLIDDLIPFMQQAIWSKHKHRHLSIFYDPAQRTDLRGELHLRLMPNAGRFTLHRNYRNTDTIYRLMQKFNPTISAPFPENSPPGREITYIDAKKLYPETAVEVGDRRALRVVLEKLIREEGVDPHAILIITCYGRTRSYWLRERKHQDLGEWRLRPLSQGVRPGEIKLSTIRSAKGYESDIVILTELDGLKLTHFSARLVYTAISRARQHLVIMGRDTDLRISALRNLFNEVVGAGTTDGELGEDALPTLPGAGTPIGEASDDQSPSTDSTKDDTT